MLYFIILVVYLLLNLINIIFLYNEEKYKKTSIFLSILIITIAILFIVILNVDDILRINRVSRYFTRQELTFCKNTIMDINISFFIFSILLCLIIFFISFSIIKHTTVCDISIDLIFSGYFILLFWKRYHINKFNIDFIGLALDLRSYYLSICILPLLLRKCKKKKYSVKK